MRRFVDDPTPDGEPRHLEVLRGAIEAEDARKVGRIVDFFRRALGMNYVELLETAKRARPETTTAEWDELLAEADRLESLG